MELAGPSARSRSRAAATDGLVIGEFSLASLLHNDAPARTPPPKHGPRILVRPSRERSFFDLKLIANGRNIQNIDAAPRLRPSALEALMPDTRYYIVRHEGIWLIKFEDEEYGPYETQDEALRLASNAAEQLERHGENVEVHLVGV